MLLEIILDSTVFIVSIIAIVILLLSLLSTISERKNKAHKLELDNMRKDGIINETNTKLEKVIAEMKGHAQDQAQVYFEEWRKSELNKYIKIIEESSKESALALLSQWKIENEDRIRKDAANRSVRNVLGKVTEHLIPFSEAMKQFNPKDIRFVGSPIDLIVFDGAEELKKEEMTIWFIEIKTGKSTLSKRQQIIRDAIESNRVKWLRVDMKSFGDDVNAALSE